MTDQSNVSDTTGAKAAPAGAGSTAPAPSSGLLAAAIRRTLQARVAVPLLGVALLAGATLALQGGTDARAAVTLDPAVKQLSAPTSGFPASFADLVEQTRPAVVAVATRGLRGSASAGNLEMPGGIPIPERFRRFFEQRGGAQPGLPRDEVNGMGSGFIVDPSGLIVTNHHVIDGAQAITVILHDGTELEAHVRGIDDKTDLALLEVKTDRLLPFVRFGDSDRTRVGDWVVAVGSPFGLGGSYTAGIVSARGRDIRSGPYDDYLQIDAPINRGNSGGALFNVRGEVVGVNTAIFSPNGGNVGIGFAVPSAIAAKVVDDLRADGHVARGWLGVQIQGLDAAMAKSLGLVSARGALIASVQPDSPAAAAGMRPGDVVLAVGGESVDELRDLPRLVADAPIGKAIEMQVWRQGKNRTVNVKIGGQPGASAPLAANDQAGASGGLGLALVPLDQRARTQLGLADDATGVVIAEVAPDSPAARQQLRAGMRIEMVGQTPVSAPQEVQRAVAAARAAHDEVVLLLIADPQGERRFVALPLA